MKMKVNGFVYSVGGLLFLFSVMFIPVLILSFIVPGEYHFLVFVFCLVFGLWVFYGSMADRFAIWWRSFCKLPPVSR